MKLTLGFTRKKTPEESHGKFPTLLHGRILSYFYHTTDKTKAVVTKGSGVMVSPSCVLTCAHNLTLDEFPEYEQIAGRVTFMPGLYGKKVYYSSDASQRKLCREWGQDRNSNYDLALLKLQDSLGCQVGYIAVRANDPSNLDEECVTVTGYPGDPDYGDYPWFGNGCISIVEQEQHKIYHDSDTSKGNSGCYIAIGTSAEPVCIGIHTNGFDENSVPQLNSGVCITQDKFKRIEGWLRAFGEISSI